ncbi:MAG: type III pantothenate kinase [Anaerohalosphaeraceae bacterium]|nr:type III pantothenate kinase [Anaerohalosphaeraceae bacterium]
MNVIAIDIGNTNITVGLFLDDKEEQVVKVGGGNSEKLAEVFKDFWQQVPINKSSKEQKRDGCFVISSVNPQWAELVKQIIKEQLSEKALEIGSGKDIPLPMEMAVDEPEKVGVDRVIMAAAAYDVVGDVVAIADFGTAVTVDLVSEDGVFLGGTIFPGFGIASESLKTGTVALPNISKVCEPKSPFGKSTSEAINSGLYYSAIGGLEVIVRMYAEDLGKWPQTVVTGGNMEIIRGGCMFVESFVSDLAVKGIVLAYKKFIGEKI